MIVFNFVSTDIMSEPELPKSDHGDALNQLSPGDEGSGDPGGGDQRENGVDSSPFSPQKG